MIFALGSAADSTFLHLVGAMRDSGECPLVFDVVQTFLEGGYFLDPTGQSVSHLRLGTARYEIEPDDAFWIRLPNLVEGAPDQRVGDLVRAFQTGLAQAFARPPWRVVNPPFAEPSNFSKVAHLLYLAQASGLQVPRSLLTNNPDEARAFVDDHAGMIIFKGASSRKTWAQAWDEARDAPRLGDIRRVPVLFQERVPGPDVRVHAVDGNLHAEVIESAEADYRVGDPISFSAIRVPEDVHESCLRVAELTGLPLLGIDFKIDSRTGEWVFLEANSMPAFEGYDARAGGRISADIIHYLTHSHEPAAERTA